MTRLWNNPADFADEMVDGFVAATAADAATRAAASTAELLPRMGRARPHAEKSLGTPDPGAHSLALIATAVAAVLERN